MLHYSVFWMEEEFSRHYFYRSEILYRFFNEWMDSPRNKAYHSQFNYVTRKLPAAKIIAHLHSASTGTVQRQQDEWLIQLGKQQIKCKIAGRSIEVDCEFHDQIENLLFQPLRQFHNSFFAMETYKGNYGWVSVEGKRTSTLNHQLLYSFH